MEGASARAVVLSDQFSPPIETSPRRPTQPLQNHSPAGKAGL